MKSETKEERLLHAIYDAWKYLEEESELRMDQYFAGAARAILIGQLDKEQYEPFIRYGKRR